MIFFNFSEFKKNMKNNILRAFGTIRVLRDTHWYRYLRFAYSVECTRRAQLIHHRCVHSLAFLHSINDACPPKSNDITYIVLWCGMWSMCYVIESKIHKCGLRDTRKPFLNAEFDHVRSDETDKYITIYWMRYKISMSPLMWQRIEKQRMHAH